MNYFNFNIGMLALFFVMLVIPSIAIILSLFRSIELSVFTIKAIYIPVLFLAYSLISDSYQDFLLIESRTLFIVIWILFTLTYTVVLLYHFIYQEHKKTWEYFILLTISTPFLILVSFSVYFLQL
jgi:hypothetical protein